MNILVMVIATLLEVKGNVLIAKSYLEQVTRIICKMIGNLGMEGEAAVTAAGAANRQSLLMILGNLESESLRVMLCLVCIFSAVFG